MGVPAFFRWLSRKYPSVIIESEEIKDVDPGTGCNFYGDLTLPNPNGIEFDNLYLDMNGIIHPCTHPEDKPPPKNEDEMMIAIFDCIDRLFNIVRPRKLLYMAIDGVAPRAKMNQQRSRRFRAAKETVEKRMEIDRVRDELLSKGCILPTAKKPDDHFDSNCITPGTPFMDRLSQCLHYYIHDRMNSNPAWKQIKVILSDANVPGEGEHKIMDFIRKQRAQIDHDPNTQHVLCGADADLIMLGLATHEPNFTIIREEFLPNKPRPCDICNLFGHDMSTCVGLTSQKGGDNICPKADIPLSTEVKYIFVRLSVLREYLKKCLEMPGLPFKYDFERVLDDWVFMCFFVGNDFLPHLPSLEIREGAIDRLVELYKKCVYKTGGYLTDSGDVNLKRVQMIMTDLGNAEDVIFKERQRREQQFKAREKMKRMKESGNNHDSLQGSDAFRALPIGIGFPTPQQITNYKMEATSLRNSGQIQNPRNLKRNAAEAHLNNDDTDCDDHDEVRLWEDGFKDRYYESKFDISSENHAFRYSVALQYVRGLCWVLKYYYQGCASWNWYYPYHYAPFASDFVNIEGLSTNFEKGTKPFNPLEQLMGVFPAASSSHVPEPWAELMTDPRSPIIDFYPEDFKIDLNGKKFAWQGVALLPFVEEQRLFKALQPFYNYLSENEVRRNKTGESRLYVCSLNARYTVFKEYITHVNNQKEMSIKVEGMRGIIMQTMENTPLQGCVKSPVSGLTDVKGNTVITVLFKDPSYDDNFIFPAIRLPNAVDPPNVLGLQKTNYKPVIGFRGRTSQAYISGPGHRMLNANLNTRGNINYNSGNNFVENTDMMWQNRTHFGYSQTSERKEYWNRQNAHGYQHNFFRNKNNHSGGSEHRVVQNNNRRSNYRKY